MEDVVAVEVTTKTDRKCYFITWGRIQDSVDPRPLEELVLRNAANFAIPGEPTSARVCGTLQEARDAPLFFEALLDFAQENIPFGDGYEQRRDERRVQMNVGKEIYFAGPRA